MNTSEEHVTGICAKCGDRHTAIEAKALNEVIAAVLALAGTHVRRPANHDT